MDCADGEHDVAESDAMDRWASHDRARALHPADRDAIRETEAARWLVLELFDPAAPARDLFSACARLGRLLAEAGGSPSLASATIDGAATALTGAGAAVDDARTAAARASLLEGYVAALAEAERAAAVAAWDAPACVVPIGDGAVAVACGCPTDDPEALAGWASGVAGRLAKGKVRRATLSGDPRATRELVSALELVGVDAVTDGPAPGSRPRWRLPWRR